MKELLQLLKQNARLSNAELAAMLGRDEVTVTKQIKELEESGVIRGYSVIVDEELADKNEVSAYIYRENVIFTVIGALIGLFVGFWLHKLMLNYIVVDSVMYGKSIKPLSYVIAFAATVILSILVDLMLRRKLRNVSMVESFKSID